MLKLSCKIQSLIVKYDEQNSCEYINFQSPILSVGAPGWGRQSLTSELELRIAVHSNVGSFKRKSFHFTLLACSPVS